MGIIIQIAIRNLKEHRLKSIIICSLIALGMFLLVMGNSILDTGKVGIEKSFIQSFSGHILVGPTGKDGQKPAMIRGGFSAMMGEQPKTVPEYQSVLSVLNAHSEIETLDPQVYSVGSIQLSDEYQAYAGFFGVDVDVYAKMFPDNIEMLSGSFLKADQEGILLSEKIYKDIKKEANMDIKVGDSLQIMGFGMGTKIMNLPVVGIFRYRTANTTMQELCFMDVSSLRYLQGMVVGAADQIKVKDQDQNLMSLSADNVDSLFATETTATTDLGSGEADAYSDSAMKARFGDTEKRAALNKADSGAWHYILLRLKDGGDIPGEIAKLNAEFKAKGWAIEAVDWETAAGQIASMINGIRFIFFILVIIISVVAIIVIMNTLVVSIVERTAEIGTMRALGAQRSYIRLIFTSETFALSVVGGIVGLVVASLFILLFYFIGLPAPNELFEAIFGGKILHPVLSWTSALQSMVIMMLVGLLSSLYPTYIALRIQPVTAMQSN